ncbi:efflux transporter outer membrane subunit [Niveibacterium terrae]|uniref:efflux transporter outer membrane subunit n=1 Tax=Niveibacterium terrae TaxID=3373598 RepID=UPI003A945122
MSQPLPRLPFQIDSSPFPRLRTSLLMVGLLTLAACAQMPELGAMPQIKSAEKWEASQSLAAPEQAWLPERWWQSYGDAQLDALIDDALAGSPSLRAAEARLRRAEAGVQTADSATGPQVSANASAEEAKQSYNLLMPRSALPDGWKDYGRMTLDFSWELDFWGRNRAALAAATSERHAVAADAAQARLMLSTSVASAYAELARLHAARDTAAAAVEVRSKTCALFHQRYANGLETLGSVRQADSRMAGAQGELLAADEQIALLRNRIAALLGAGPDRGLAIARPTIKLDRAPGLPEKLALNLLGRRPDVVAARLRAEAAAKRIDAARAEFYPNVNLSAFIGVQSLGLDKLFKSGSDIGSVGPAISLPIFNGGRLKAQVKGRRADYDEAVANYEATVTEALHEVADSAVSWRALAGQLDRCQAAVAAAREAWQIARNRYDGGLSNYLDVLTAEDALLASQRQLSDLQSRAFSIDVAMARALGGGFRSDKS